MKNYNNRFQLINDFISRVFRGRLTSGGICGFNEVEAGATYVPHITS